MAQEDYQKGFRLKEVWEWDLAHGLGMDEVVVAPDAGVVVVLPLHVDVEVGEVVALRDGEFLPHLVTFLLTALQTHTGVSLLSVSLRTSVTHTGVVRRTQQ